MIDTIKYYTAVVFLSSVLITGILIVGYILYIGNALLPFAGVILFIAVLVWAFSTVHDYERKKRK
jgi:hypothetical protein